MLTRLARDHPVGLGWSVEENCERRHLSNLMATFRSQIRSAQSMAAGGAAAIPAASAASLSVRIDDVTLDKGASIAALKKDAPVPLAVALVGTAAGAQAIIPGAAAGE